MRSYVETISDESIRAILELENSSVQFLYFPTSELALGSSSIIAPSVSIRLGNKKFLIIESTWLETAHDLIDYFSIGASISDRPKGLKVKEKPNGECWTYFNDHTSLHVGKLTRVSAVELLENHCQEGTETVKYDAGFIIRLASGQSIAICGLHSCTSNLEVSHSPDSIAGLLSGLEIRKEYVF